MKSPLKSLNEEMRDYPNGPAKGEKPMGRIRILEDKDGDGFFETSTIWADNLLFANGTTRVPALGRWRSVPLGARSEVVSHARCVVGLDKSNFVSRCCPQG